VKPSALEPLASFALLGPGYGGGAFTLLTGLEETDGSEGALVYAPFEMPGRRARRFRGTLQALDGLEPEALPPPPRAELEAAGHAAAVASIREDIAAGDVYQVCLTVRARLGACAGSALWAALGARGVARFAAWVRLPDGTELVSAAPELLLEVAPGRIRCEPMKGTARAGEGGVLRASEKDAAELAMITDLVRNDITLLCRPRTVRVVSERRLVELPYAVQTVSEVEGEPLPGVGVLDALGAVHPGGSVTGAPKRAALERIARLEDSPRGAYCGALGLCTGERATFALLIRTAEKCATGWVYGVGSGIVYDSQAEHELDELRVKLGALG
jgi:anthranilate/para-aminobenzoate synthase component I